MPPLQPEMFDIGVQRIGDPQTIQSEEARQPVVAATGKVSLDQEHAQFVAIQAGGVRFVVQFRAP